MAIQRINLKGKIFGNLTVIEHDDHRTKNGRKPFWKCQCKCGNITSVRAESLKMGHTRSCGCQKTQLIPGPKNSNFKGYEDIPLTLWSQIKERSNRIKVSFDLSIEY